MREAFSLAITIWISLALMAGSIYFIQTNNKTVKNYMKLSDKLDASNSLLSDTELVKFYLATGNFYFNVVENKNFLDLGLPEEIRIDSQDIKVGDTLINIQDTAGIINMFYPDVKQLSSVLKLHNINYSSSYISAMKDWFDKDRSYYFNGAEDEYYSQFNYSSRNSMYVQYIDEIDLIKEWSNHKDLSLSKYFSYVPTTHVINIATMPMELLKEFYNIGESDIRILSDLKANNEKTGFYSYFSQVPNKENFDGMNHGTYPSKALIINAISKKGTAAARIKVTVDFNDNTNISKTF